MLCSGSQFFNLDIYQGDYFSLGIVANDNSGNGIDLSSYSCSGAIKIQYSSGEFLTFDSNLSNNPTGFLTISLSSSGTSTLPVGQQLYQINIYPSGSPDFIPILKGYANIYPSIL